MTPRILAIDWSGAVDGAKSKIWLAEAADGRLVRLEPGRDRDAIADYLIAERRRTPELIVGLDFAFGLPEWFLEERGLQSGPDLWNLVAAEGERWLGECAPPFWGRPGKGRPAIREELRRTDREVPAVGGIRPKSVFQVGGAGAVGTGSLRGMPVLARLRDAGFAVWPFDEPGESLVIEIYPRLLTGAVNKGDGAARREYLARHHPDMDAKLADLAAGSEDAFDAAVSAVIMSAHADELRALALPDDPQLRREGVIWAPVATRRDPAVVEARVRRQYDSSLTRVQPVFDALRTSGKAGWVAELLDLVGGESADAPWRGLDLTIEEGRWGASEVSLQPPVSLLSWLIRNLAQAGTPRPSGESDTDAWRAQLWDADPPTVAEALQLLRTSRAAKSWHLLEGPTRPDAYIVTPDALIVVEGKRTEASATTTTTWMQARHQMLRHLDAAWEIRGRRRVFGFFIVEGDTSADPMQVPASWQDAVTATRSATAIAGSLPHRGPDEQAAIERCFLGAVTWQRVVARFGLDEARVLPSTTGALRT